MPELQVKKVVAVCFLEGVKQTLEHLGAYRLQLTQQEQVPHGAQAANRDAMTRMYGDIRRLRDYLQRCASAYEDKVVLDVDSGDAQLLVACCRRSVCVIDNRIELGGISESEREWLKKKRTILGDWAVEVAEGRLLELPMPRVNPVKSQVERSLDARLQDKVFGDVNKRQKIHAPRRAVNSSAAGIASFGEAMADISLEESGVMTKVEQGESTPLAADASVATDEQASSTDENDQLEQLAGPVLLDRRRITDPRLRSLIRVDLLGLQRCLQAHDYRLATLLMASIVEAAVIDHVIPRRADFGLSGTPDSWKIQDLLLRAMGDAVQPKDRSLVFHLFASRNLLRPALQMMAPAVVTAASFERLQEFVRRALHAIGFGAAAPTTSSSDESSTAASDA